jgi:hypothetical protein
MNNWTMSKKTALLIGLGFAATLLLAQSASPVATPAPTPVAKPVEVVMKSSGPGRYQIMQVALPATVAGGSTVIKIDTETGATWCIGQGNPQTNHAIYVWYKMLNMTLTGNGSIYDPSQ